MRNKTRKKKVPQLKYTKLRNIGWHVTFRDPKTGMPRKHRFDVTSRGEAEKQYHEWVAAYLQGMLPEKAPRRKRRLVDEDPVEKLEAVESQ